MTKTKRSFAILLAAVFLIVNAVSFVAFAEDTIPQADITANQTAATEATDWYVNFENIQNYFVSTTGNQTLTLSPVVYATSDNTQLADLTGLASDGTYTVTYSVNRAHAVKVSETGVVSAVSPGVGFVTARVENTLDGTYAEKTIGIVAGPQMIGTGDSFESGDTTVARSGSASFLADGSTINYTATDDTALDKGIATFYFYDNMETLDAEITLVPHNTSRIKDPGSLKIDASGYYSAAEDPQLGAEVPAYVSVLRGQDNPVPRSLGWHQVVIDGSMDTTGYEIWIDGVLVRRMMTYQSGPNNREDIGGVKGITATATTGSLWIDDTAAFSAVRVPSEGVPSISFNGYRQGGIYSLSATPAPADATCTSYDISFDNDDVIQVLPDGRLFCVGAGDVNVTVKTLDGGFNALGADTHDPDVPFETTIPVTVAENPSYVELTGFSIAETNVTVAPGASYQILATYTPSNATIKDVTYTSSDDSIATVSETGLVTPQAGAVNGASVAITAEPLGCTLEQPATVTITYQDMLTADNLIARDFMDSELSDGTIPSPDDDYNKDNGPLLQLVQADPDNGFSTGWVNSIADLTAPDPTPVADYHRIITSTYQNEKYLTMNIAHNPAIADGTQSMGYAYRGFTPEAQIDFDTDAVYYISFLMNQGNQYGGRYMDVTFGNLASVHMMVGKLSDNATDSNYFTATLGTGSTGQSSTYPIFNRMHKVVVKLVTSARGTDTMYVSAFGPRRAMVGDQVVESDNTADASWEPSSWDIVCSNTVTGKAGFIGISVDSFQPNMPSQFGALEIYKTEQVPVTDIVMSDAEINLQTSQTFQAGVTVLPSNASVKDVTWSSDDSNIASVDANGLITGGQRVGTTMIHATDASGTVSSSILVHNYQTVTALDLSKSVTDTSLEKSINLTLTATRSDGTVTLASNGTSNGGESLTFTSSDPSVASVTNSGVVTGNKKGVATITATFNNTMPDAPVPTVSTSILVTVTSDNKLEVLFNDEEYDNAIGDRRGQQNSYSLTPDTVATEPTMDDIQEFPFTAAMPVANGIGEGWFYYDGTPKMDTGLVFVGEGDDKLFVGADDATSMTNFTIDDNGNKQASSVTLKRGWNQIAAVVDGSNTTVYINGQQAYQKGATKITGITVKAVKNYADAAGSAVARNSYFDDLNVYSVDDVAPYIQANSLNFTQSGMNLTATYSFISDESEGDSVITWYVRRVNSSSTTQIASGAGNKTVNVSSYAGYEAMVEVTPVTKTGVTGQTVSSPWKIIVNNNAGTGTGTGTGNGGGISVTDPGVVVPTPGPTSNAFTDITGHWAVDDINFLARLGLLNGYEDHSFKPNNSITRAEFTKMVVTAVGLASENYISGYSDVSSGDWFANYVAAATKAGLVSGSDGMFRPNDLITREEMAKIVVAAYQVKTGKAMPDGSIDGFTDKDMISSWAVDYVKAANTLGIVKGMTEDTFVPKDNATRAQAAVMIKRLLDAQ